MSAVVVLAAVLLLCLECQNEMWCKCSWCGARHAHTMQTWPSPFAALPSLPGCPTDGLTRAQQVELLGRLHCTLAGMLQRLLERVPGLCEAAGVPLLPQLAPSAAGAGAGWAGAGDGAGAATAAAKVVAAEQAAGPGTCGGVQGQSAPCIPAWPWLHALATAEPEGCPEVSGAAAAGAAAAALPSAAGAGAAAAAPHLQAAPAMGPPAAAAALGAAAADAAVAAAAAQTGRGTAASNSSSASKGGSKSGSKGGGKKPGGKAAPRWASRVAACTSVLAFLR